MARFSEASFDEGESDFSPEFQVFRENFRAAPPEAQRMTLLQELISQLQEPQTNGSSDEQRNLDDKTQAQLNDYILHSTAFDLRNSSNDEITRVISLQKDPVSRKVNEKTNQITQEVFAGVMPSLMAKVLGGFFPKDFEAGASE